MWGDATSPVGMSDGHCGTWTRHMSPTTCLADWTASTGAVVAAAGVGEAVPGRRRGARGDGAEGLDTEAHGLVEVVGREQAGDALGGRDAGMDRNLRGRARVRPAGFGAREARA